MTEKRYKAIRIEDYNDEPVQYCGVYVTRWNDDIMGQPSMLFVEIEDDQDGETNDIHSTTGQIPENR